MRFSNLPRPFCEEEGGGGATPPLPTLSELIAQLEGHSLDEILAESKTLQSQFDKKITSSSETVRRKTEDRMKALFDDKLTEQERLAKMSEEEKLAFEHKKREDELVKREKALEARELKATAKALLAERGLEQSLADYLNYESAETVKTSIEGLESVMRTQVQNDVNKKLEGINTSIKDSQTEGDNEEIDPLDAKIQKYTKGN